jgi:hypothetical protein
MTAGNQALLDSLKTMFEKEGPERASQGQVDAELMQSVRRALHSSQGS